MHHPFLKVNVQCARLIEGVDGCCADCSDYLMPLSIIQWDEFYNYSHCLLLKSFKINALCFLCSVNKDC